MPSRIPKTTLLDLPSEILQHIGTLAGNVDMSNLALANRALLTVLEDYLYRSNLEVGTGHSPALLWAVSSGTVPEDVRLRVIDKAIKAGANVNAAIPSEIIKDAKLLLPTDKYGPTAVPLLAVALHNKLFAACERLIGAGADINLESPRTDLESPVSNPGPPVFIVTLLDSYTESVSSDLESPDTDQGPPTLMSALWTVVISKNAEAVQFLMDQPGLKFDVNRTDYSCLLSDALCYSTPQIVKQLLPYSNPNRARFGFLTLLDKLVYDQQPAMVAVLLSDERLRPDAPIFRDQTEPPTTAFVFSCERGNLEIIKMLHDDPRVDVDYASTSLNDAVTSAVGGNHVDAVKFLLRSKKATTARAALFEYNRERRRPSWTEVIVECAGDEDAAHAQEWASAAREAGLTEVAEKIDEKWNSSATKE